MTHSYQLPDHGRIQCALCHHPQSYGFDRTRTEENGWRITNNPLAWGGTEPEVVVLGFSKGPTQSGALTALPHDAIAYKGGRSAVAKILHHIGLLEHPEAHLVDSLIGDRNGRIHFGSLIRCTVERWDEQERIWKGTGGGMLDRFVATSFGSEIAQNCGSTFLAHLPSRTHLVVMLGLGSKLNYVRSCRALFEHIRPGPWKQLNDIAYTDNQIVVVHTEHFASQGNLLPNWLSGEKHERGQLGLLAQEAVKQARIQLSKDVRGIATPPLARTLPTNGSADRSRRDSHRLHGNSLSEPTLDPVSAQLGDGHGIPLTDGAIRNGNLSLNSIRHVIPPGGVGGTNRNELGRLFIVRFEPGSSVETDVAGDKMTLRCRGAVREFLKRIGAKLGDNVRIRAEGSRTLVITHQRR
ncbi:hypothetical protein [Mesorhizobium sp. M0571]|uniref:hypothetical protein n=1 Tax=Mesorhizobium sp. M0571 TaxID=2956960 RepID=UPI00333E033E